MHARSALVLLIACLGASACHPERVDRNSKAPEFTAPTWLRTELFFGLHQRDGSLVSDEAWRAFVDDHVTPGFPDGLTIVEAAGQYRDAQGQIHREPARILILLYPAEARAEADAKLRTIAAEYARRFNQESVLRTDAPQAVEFLGATPP